jgi:hypothetical protein
LGKSLKTSVFRDLQLKTHILQPVGREIAKERLKTTSLDVPFIEYGIISYFKIIGIYLELLSNVHDRLRTYMRFIYIIPSIYQSIKYLIF